MSGHDLVLNKSATQRSSEPCSFAPTSGLSDSDSTLAGTQDAVERIVRVAPSRKQAAIVPQ